MLRSYEVVSDKDFIELMQYRYSDLYLNKIENSDYAYYNVYLREDGNFNFKLVCKNLSLEQLLYLESKMPSIVRAMLRYNDANKDKNVSLFEVSAQFDKENLEQLVECFNNECKDILSICNNTIDSIDDAINEFYDIIDRFNISLGRIYTRGRMIEAWPDEFNNEQ